MNADVRSQGWTAKVIAGSEEIPAQPQEEGSFVPIGTFRAIPRLDPDSEDEQEDPR